MDPVDAKSIRWERLELAYSSDPPKYTLFFFGQDDGKPVRGKADLNLPDCDSWAALAQSLRDEFQCDVSVVMPEGSVPKRVLFRYGETHRTGENT